MAYEFLKKLFGTTEDGQPKAMTYEELEAAIDADKKIQVIDLKAGGYVAKEKLDTKITELEGVRQQLTDANTTIQSYKDMDIEGIQKSAKEWETKYNTETKALNDKLVEQERTHQEERFLDTVGLKPGAMYREFVKKAFEAKNLPLENGKFIGADEVIASLKEDPEYKDAFVVETKGDDSGIGGTGVPGTNPQNQQLLYFTAGTNSQTQEPKGSTFNFGFTGVRKREKD